jgi:integrase
MATVKMRINKDGQRVFRIRFKLNEIEYQRTWPDKSIGEQPIPLTWSDKRARSEAARIAFQFEKDCKEGLVSKEKRTFSEYANYVIDFKESTSVLKPTTIDSYRDLMFRIENANLGDMLLTDITAKDINLFYQDLSQNGLNKKTGGKLSAKTIKEYHSFIHSVLQQAAKEGIVRFNVAAYATPPKVERKEAECYSPETISKILDAVESEEQHWKAITYVLVGTGARRGEVAALRWSDINYKDHTIRIRRNITRAKAGGLVVGSPKTGDERTVSVVEEVIHELKAWELRQKSLFQTYDPEGFCFAFEDPDIPIDPDSITTFFHRFGVKHGLGNIHPHAFRHSQASILLQSGDVVMASRRLGHSRTSTTLDIYGHMMPLTDKAAAEKVGEAFFRKAKHKDAMK